MCKYQLFESIEFPAETGRTRIDILFRDWIAN